MEGWRGLYFLLLVLFRTDHHRVEAELVQTFDVLEGVPIGTIIGVIGSDTGGSDIPQPPYLIVPLAGSSDPDADLIINQKTGEIRTKSELDREKTRSYSLSAIPVNGDSISVTVRVQDVNDNSPEFVPDVLQLDIPENIPSGTRRKLAPAVDQDLGDFGTRDYAIASGNVGDVFEVSYDVSNPRLDLVVKGDLDREKTDSYTLVIVARDGGSPPRTGSLTLKVNVQDLNDSPPLFTRQRYFTSVSADLEVGSSILKVEATDADKGDNSRVTYSINRRQSDRDRHFDIDSQTGLLTLSKKLDFERQNVHEIVIVARDGGEVPQETSAFITVRVSGLGENQNLGSESGESSGEYTESPIPPVAVPAPGSNENVPEFESKSYSVEVLESADPGSSVLKVKATDKDLGENGHIMYSLRFDENGSKTYSDWFEIDKDSGLITTQSYLDCELEGAPKVIIVATDQGNPPKSSSAVLQVSLTDVNDNKPLFESSFYDVQLSEDVNPGHCFLTLKAKDMDCGNNAIVHYSFQDEGSDTFKIGSNDGKMCLAQQLDHEAKDVHNVIVLATDKGGLSTSTLVRVSVNDVNDNFPEFAPSSYDATIASGHPLNLPVMSLKASDGDSGSNAAISYTISTGNEDGSFSLDARSGDLYLTRQLNSGQRSQLLVEATDGQDKKSTNQANIDIFVVDNFPIKNIYKFEAREDVSPYSEIGKMDVPPGFEVTILESSYPGYFSIHPTNGVLRSEGRLDHEVNPRVLINLKLTSDNEELFSQVIVDITDVNDNAPEFAVPLIVLSVPEDFPSGENAKVLYVCSATDADSNLNGKISYKFRSEDPKFSIDPVTAEIRLMSSLDFETETQHELVIEAEDSGQPRLKSSMKLTLLVHDINDNEPVFENSTYNARIVQSLTTNGAPIVTVRATDRDQGRNGRITYQVSRNPYFKMLPTKGSLVLKRPLDKEARDVIEVTVTAVDHGSPSLQATTRVQIFLADRNDHSPIFEEKSYVFLAPENSDVGHVIGAVQARDEDKGRNGEIQYRLRTTIKKFVIEASSGQISISELLDREEKSEYELLVEAVDRGQPPKSSQTVVKVMIEDVNDKSPELEHPASRTLFARELSSAGTVLGKVTAIDKDKDDKVTYEIIDGSSLVSIDRTNGEVQLKRTLRFEDSNFTLAVRFSDSASPPHQVTEVISVQVVSDDSNQLSPFDISPRELSVNEMSASIGSFVGSIASPSSVGGGKNGSSIFYYFVSKSKDFPFYVNAATGDVYVMGPINATLKSSYDVEVSIGSEDLPPQTSRLVIKVTGNVDGSRPSFPTDPIIVRVPENRPVGERILTVAPDNKATKTSWPLKYQIIEQSPSDSFDLNQKTGELKIFKSLDYENVQSHLLTVRVSGNDDVSTEFQYSTLLTVAVIVEDVNDFKPIFLSTDNVEISSDIPLNRPFFTIIAADEDSGEWGVVKYAIQDGNADDVFYVDEKSGELSLKKSPLAVSSQFQLTVRAEDGGQLFSVQMLKISVRQELTIAPKFLDKIINVDVAENLPPNSRVTLLQVNNPLAEDLEYSIYVSDEIEDSKSFLLDPSTGELKTGATLDRELRSEYLLVVGVTSKRSRSWRDAAEVRIRVVDVNDNDPTFGQTCRSVDVPENAPDSSFVHAVVAYDSDSGENGRITYSLSGGESSFKLDPESGKLFAGSLDREKKSEYDLMITATDNGETPRSATCSIAVKVLDKNDNDPSFPQSIYSASVKEDVPKGTEVLRVIATDADDGRNAEVRYSIRNASDLSFSIGETSGAIITTGPLDREAVSEYTFFVVASDGGQDTVRSSSAKVTVLITDANDHTPEFDEFPFRINSTATPSVGVPLLRLTATDPDLGPNGQLTFNLVRPEHRAIFDLTPEDGILTVSSTTDLAWDPATLTVLEVSVSDAGRPPRSSTGLVEIKIEGGPATKLDFQQEVYFSEIEENPPSGADLIQVRAVRSDGRRQRVIYTFLRGNELGAFEINSNNGLIRVRDPEMIDYERNREFVLTIAGQGLGEENLNAYAKCVIKVRNVNDNTPRFSQTIYESGILEGLPKNSIVTRVEAFDLDDQDDNGSRLIYEIVDGNVDGAFTIKSSSLGLVLTNTVLDREIRDRYELTISAKDQGSPSLTGTTKVVVLVLDVNDSPLQFPAVAPMKISKGLRPGALIGTVRANDIDTFPPISYRIISNDVTDKTGGDDATNVTEVAVDTFTGQIYLLQKPSDWKSNPLVITISASDQTYSAERQISLYYEEASKDCRPRFKSALYLMEVDANVTLSSSPKIVGQVGANSCGSDADIQYFVEDDNDGIFSLASNGSLIIGSGGLKGVNVSVVSIGAKDRKSKKVGRAVVSVKLRTQPLTKIEFLDFPNDVKVDLSKREIFKVKVSTDEKLIFSMTPNEIFKIDSSNGIIYNVKKNKAAESVTLDVTVRRFDESVAAGVSKKLKLVVSPSSDKNEPRFSTINATIPSTASLSETIQLCPSLDKSDDPSLQIVSGNEDHLFTLDNLNRRLLLSRRPSSSLASSHYVVVRMGTRDRFSLCRINIFVLDDATTSLSANKTLYFPISDAVTSVAENLPVGTFVFQPPVVVSGNEQIDFWTESDLFSVDQSSGAISTRVAFDFESSATHHLQVFAKNKAGQSVCNVQVLVESVDEYPPVFGKTQYLFNLPRDATPGDLIGQVHATDRDDGIDGQIVFSLATPHPYFNVNPSKGTLLVSRSPDTGLLHEPGARRLRRSVQEVRLVLEAKSRRIGSLSSSVQVFVSVDEMALPSRAEDGSAGSVAPWVTGVIVGIVLIVIALALAALFYCRFKRAKDDKERKLRLTGSNTSGLADQSMEMSTATSSGSTSHHAISRFPPQYSEIVSDFDRNISATTSIMKGHGSTSGGCLTRSEFSEKSSGRGSVEDEEDADVEIRMINEGGYLSPVSGATGLNGPDSSNACSFLNEEDKLSEEGSVQNTEEYLARLGIDIRKPPNIKGLDGAVANAMSDHYSAGSIYNRILDETMSEHSANNKHGGGASSTGGSIYGGVTQRRSHHQPSLTGSLSSVVHSEDELAGSYNWDYLLDWGPQYRPLAHVFKEISQLRDDPQSVGGHVSPATAVAPPPPGNKILPFMTTLKNPTASRLLARPTARSPISHDVLTQSALSPNFHPALSPLATKSPSVSPMSSVPLKRDMNNKISHI